MVISNDYAVHRDCRYNAAGNGDRPQRSAAAVCSPCATASCIPNCARLLCSAALCARVAATLHDARHHCSSDAHSATAPVALTAAEQSEAEAVCQSRTPQIQPHRGRTDRLHGRHCSAQSRNRVKNSEEQHSTNAHTHALCGMHSGHRFSQLSFSSLST